MMVTSNRTSLELKPYTILTHPASQDSSNRTSLELKPYKESTVLV